MFRKYITTGMSKKMQLAGIFLRRPASENSYVFRRGMNNKNPAFTV